MGPFRSTLLTSLGCALAFVLAACGGSDPTPIVAPPSSNAPSTPAPSDAGPQAPAMPAVAREHTAAGAKSYAHFYWATVNYAQRTGDLSGLAALTRPQCRACTGGLQFLQEVYRSKGHVEGGATRISHIVLAPLRVPGQRGFSMRMRVSNGPQRVIYGNGKPTETHAGATASLSMILEETGAGWRVSFWDVSS